MLQRQRFDIAVDSDTGSVSDTGPPFTGLVLQMHFEGGNLDTGADIRLEMVNSGVVVADWDNVGGVWTRVPRLLTYDTGGAALGDQYAVAAHDRLRLTVSQGASDTGGKTGSMHVVTGW